MTKNPPNRRGITFEVGAQLEARDRLKKWYAAHIEEIDYEEGKVLIHFKRWNHRYDEWFCWDSPYLRPLEKIQLRREGLVEEEPQVVYRVNEQVLACWSDCRFYPAKITAINKDGTYTVKFFDGVVQTVKNIHVKAFSKDQSNLSCSKQREKVSENTSPSDKHRGKFWEEKKSTENTNLKKVKSSASDQKPPAPSEKKLLISERTKPLEKNPVKNEKEDKENISENEREHSVDPQCEERAAQNDTLKASQENGERRKKGCISSSSSMTSGSHSLQPVTLELRRRKISIGSEIQSKRPRLDKKNISDEKVGEKNEKVVSDEQTAATEDIRENEDNEHLAQYLANGTKGTLHIMMENPLPPAQQESLQELVSASNHSKEDRGNLNPASTQEPIEAKEPSEPESIMKSTAADIFMPSDKPEKEQSLQNHTEATTVTVTNTLKKTNNPAPKAVTLDLDPNMFKCKLLDCSKFFRKAKLLHYHMKYFHGIEKAEQDQSTVTRHMQTRGSLAHEKTTREPAKRRWTTPGSLYLPKLHDKLSERRHSTPAPIITDLHRQTLREESREKEIQKVYRVPDRLSVGVNDKAREKSKDSLNPKSKKKKRKKKSSKSELSGSEENIDMPSLKKTALVKPNHDFKSQFPLRNPLLRSLDPGLQRDAAKISDEDTLSDSCTESLLWSDEDYNEEIDVTNADEELDEEDGDCEIVRCMCEVQEENDFMIQCEDCLCWQHGLCMGLLEDNVPERYSCYICQDPPGQRLSLKYWYDKEWLNKGHMHGLPFLEENYSHQNAKKIVSTHQLLGDIQRVIEVLHGLQLKIGILQSKEHQDMKYWGQPWKHMLSDKCYIRCSSEEACKEDSTNYRTYNGEADKPPPLPAMEESYITSEHCYQKPRTYYPAVEQRLVVETRSSALDAGVDQIQQCREDSIAERLGWELDRELIKSESESKHNYCKVRECLTKRNPSQESSKPLDNGGATINKQIQWQLNLLAHLESLQDEVTHRMDFIEKELDVLESFLDYTGELEPPEPLARLPQLKHRIKQLLMDLGKVEQIALCYST